MKTVVAVFSGGLDSAVLLHHLLDRGDVVRALSIDYGQRHSCELRFAAAMCSRLEFHGATISHRQVDVSGLHRIMRGSSQTDPSVAVPEGHYAEESMKATVVPNRNMLLLSIAGAYAVSTEADTIAYAAHAGDHAIYPDCRPEFVDLCEQTLHAGNYHQVEIERPFIRLSKADIVRLGSRLGVPFALTWSCYKGNGSAHCGKCGTCVERREAFVLAGVTDVTTYSKFA